MKKPLKLVSGSFDFSGGCFHHKKTIKKMFEKKLEKFATSHYTYAIFADKDIIELSRVIGWVKSSEIYQNDSFDL